MARSSELTDEIIQEAKNYAINFADHGHAIPSVVGLCSVINRSRSTIYRWAEIEGGGFRDILDEINERQELELLNKGLRDDFNSNITKLVLGKHGYHDKSDSTLSGPGGKPVEVDSTITFVGV